MKDIGEANQVAGNPDQEIIGEGSKSKAHAAIPRQRMESRMGEGRGRGGGRRGTAARTERRGAWAGLWWSTEPSPALDSSTSLKSSTEVHKYVHNYGGVAEYLEPTRCFPKSRNPDPDRFTGQPTSERSEAGRCLHGSQSIRDKGFGSIRVWGRISWLRVISRYHVCTPPCPF